MTKDASERSKTVMQVIGVAGLVGIMAMLFHKGFTDISVIWERHSGSDFWIALARYLFRNLAG